jgi:hypothetical protein
MRKILSAFCLMMLCAPSFAQSGRSAKSSDPMPYRHSLNFTPFGFTVTYKEFNPAAGISYEYMIDPEAGISFNLPVTLGYVGPEQSDFYYSQSYRHTVFFAAPGVRFHTGRRRSAVDFATGPSIIAGNMSFRPTDSYYGPASGEAFNYGLLGLSADNSLNFYRNHFAFGFDLRVGTMFEERRDTRFFLNFGMHFGGIF